MLQRLLTFFFLITLLSANVLCAEKMKDLVIQADNMLYSEDGTIVEAHGNVLATHKDIVIKAKNLTYKVDKGTVHACEGFYMEMEGKLSFTGDTLDYNVKTRVGDAKDVHLDFNRSKMTGERINLSDEEMNLNSASFSGCDRDERHYHITASRLILYPDEGWLICYFGYFWMYGVPLVPVPAYVFDLSSYGIGRRSRTRNVPPIPEFGSNEEDGSGKPS